MISSEQATNRTKDFLDLLGCSLNSEFANNTDLLNCAQTIDPTEIVYQTDNYAYILFDENLLTMSHNMFAFPLVMNGIDFKVSIEDAFKKKKFKKCKILLGYAENGASSLLHVKDYFGFDKKNLTEISKIDMDYLKYYLNNRYRYYPSFSKNSSENFTATILKTYVNATTNKTAYFDRLSLVVTDQLFACPCYKLAEIFCAFTDVFVYTYSHRISSSIYPRNFGAVHGDELPVFFGEPISVKQQPLASINFWSSTIHTYPTNEKKFSEKLLKYMSNLIHFDTPNDLDQDYDDGEDKSNLIDTYGKLDYWPLFKFDYELLARQSKKWIESGNYLNLKAGQIKLSKGYAAHNCELWGLK